tara:strand:- start:69 stop:305 length:237 start_codon:yes stop_codon:yes gene_type:complete
MSSEEEALKLLQGINKEVIAILSEMKAKRKQMKNMDIADITKLGEIGQQLQAVKNHINDFINRYDKQTSLQDFNTGEN